MKCKQFGRGTSRTRGLETTRVNKKQLRRASRLSLHLYHEIRKNTLLRAILLRQVQKQPSLIKRKQPGWGIYKFRKNLDEVQTTWKRYIKNQISLQMTWLNKKQLRRASRLSQTLSSGAQHFASTTPGGSDSRTKDQEYKYSRLQQRQHIKTLQPISILKKSTRRRLEGYGIHNPKIFFEDKNLDPPTFASKSKRLRGYT